MSLFAGFCLPLNAAMYDWSSARQQAKDANPDYLSAKKSFEASQATYRATLNELFPNLSLSANYTDASEAVRDDRWGANATASMDLFNLRNVARVRNASANMNSVQARFAQQSAELRLNLKKAFATLFSAQELIDVTNRIRKIRETNAQTVSFRYDSGRESKGNKLRVEAELAQAVADQQQATRILRLAQQELNHQLGENPYAVNTATGTLQTGPLPPTPDLGTLTKDHPRLVELRSNIAVAEANLSDARSPIWPTLSASYTRSVDGPTFFPDQDYRWAVSGVVSYPLFGGGPTYAYYTTKAARASLEKAQQDYWSGEILLRTQLESSWASFANALDRVDVQDKLLIAARQRNAESQVRYSMGYISFDDWERAVEDLVNSEKGAIQASQDALIAEANWERALAKPVEEP